LEIALLSGIHGEKRKPVVYNIRMHELAVAESLIKTVLEKSEDEEASRVVKVTIVVGNLAGVVTDSLHFCFDEVARDTIAEGATLEIETVSATAFCQSCRDEFEVGQYDFACPRCGGVIIPSGGMELYIKDIEIE